MKMGNSKRFYVHFLLVLLITLSCGEDKDSLDEFQSYGLFEATVNDENVVFSAAKAKQYSSPYLQVVGRNCSERLLIGFDIPFSTGSYNLDTLGNVFIHTQSARACPDTNGGDTPHIVREAEVTVTELSATRVRGNFSIVAGEIEINNDIVVSNGVFDVERE